ncbi:MAG: ATP-binding protein, partial [Oscillospiraceae bacterium]
TRLGDGARLATAHNSNDCAETVLLNLMRGTGLKGLCGIPPVRGNIVRPLIYCTRAEVEDYLAALGEGFVTDRTNLSDDYTRNKVRHLIIPEMLKINTALFDGMTRMTASLREDSDYLEEQARLALSRAEKGRGWDAAALSELPPPIRSRAVRIILSGGGIEPSALRINTAASLLDKRSARYNPCKDRFFTIRKGVCFVEKTEQHIRRHENKGNC